MASGGDASADELTLWVKREGAVTWVELTVIGRMSLSRVMKETATMLKMDGPLDSFTLHEAKDTEGKDLGAALDSRATVAALGLKSGTSLVIKATAPARSGAGGSAAAGAGAPAAGGASVGFASADALPAMLEKLSLKLDALDARTASVLQREHLSSPSVLGSRTLEALRTFTGYFGMFTFSGSEGPAVLGPKEREELLIACAADNEAGVVRYLTPVLWNILLGIPDEPPVPSLRRLLVNSKNFGWLDHLTCSVSYVNRQKPDLYVTWEAFVHLREGNAGKQGTGEEFYFGPLAHWTLQQDGCVTLVLEAKKEPLTPHHFGELVDYHSHLPGQVHGVLFNQTDFWLTEAVNGSVHRMKKCRWHQAGIWERLRQHFAAACRPPRLSVLLARLLVDLKVTLVPNSFIGAGATGRVFAVQGVEGPRQALKVVIDPVTSLALDAEYTLLGTAARKGAPVVHPVGDSLKLYDGLGGGYLMSAVGTGILADKQTQIRRVFEALQHVHALGIIHGDARLPNAVDVDGSVLWLDFRFAVVEPGSLGAHARADMRTLSASVLNVKADSLPAAVADAVDLYESGSSEGALTLANAVWAAKRPSPTAAAGSAPAVVHLAAPPSLDAPGVGRTVDETS